jgi:hypothetical protein
MVITFWFFELPVSQVLSSSKQLLVVCTGWAYKHAGGPQCFLDTDLNFPSYERIGQNGMERSDQALLFLLHACTHVFLPVFSVNGCSWCVLVLWCYGVI